MTKKLEPAITWLQINNWVPIITSAILIALSWSSLNTQIALLNQKQEVMVSIQKEMLANQKLYLQDLNAIHGRLVKLETLEGLR